MPILLHWLHSITLVNSIVFYIVLPLVHMKMLIAEQTHRLHYLRGTEQEAKDVCRSHHSDNRWRPYQRGGYSWLNSHISEGYTMFEQF
jgi:hypothetical protein